MSLLLLALKAASLVAVGVAIAEGSSETTTTSGSHSEVLLAVIGLAGIALTTLGGILGPVILEHYRGGRPDKPGKPSRGGASALTRRLREEVAARQAAEAQLVHANERIESLEDTVARLTRQLDRRPPAPRRRKTT